MVRRAVLTIGTVLLCGPAVRSADAQATTIKLADKSEVFLRVQYLGGDSRFARLGEGVLILSDSTLSYVECWSLACNPQYGKANRWKDTAAFVVPLRAIQRLEVASQNRGPTVAGRVLFGVLATDRVAEGIGVSWETEQMAEAPQFSTEKTASGMIEAKVRFRMRRLGVAPVLSPDTTRKP